MAAGIGEAQPANDAYADGVALVRAMHDRYEGKWYKTLTFVQTTTQWDSTGAKQVSTWYESCAVPSLLRINVGPPARGRGVLFTADSTYVIKDGKVARVLPGGNDLTTLLFDVYVDPVDKTVTTLRKEGYDLGKIHKDTWESHAVWVVGAKAGDLSVPQFWIDPDKMVVVRQLAPLPGLSSLSDAQFTKYERAGGGWIAMQNYFLVDGKPLQLEEYQEVKADVSLDPALFDPRQWSTAKHWVR